MRPSHQEQIEEEGLLKSNPYGICIIQKTPTTGILSERNLERSWPVNENLSRFEAGGPSQMEDPGKGEPLGRGEKYSLHPQIFVVI
jgi:hypothetical protein